MSRSPTDPQRRESPNDVRGLPPFRPHRFVRGPHAQTVFGAYLPGVRYPENAEQHRLQLDDGDALILHDQAGGDWVSGQRIALLVHGLGGGSRSGYMARTAGKLTARGLRVVRMELRGSGAGRDLARIPGHAGCSHDVAAVVAWIAERYPRSPLSLIGYSMGGNIVLKLAQEADERSLGGLDSVLALGPPIDCGACADHMLAPQNRMYTRNYLSALIKHVRHRSKAYPEWAALPLAPPPRSIREFDARFTAPLSGFASVEEYYERSSSKHQLNRIRLPTTIITADDDPVVPARIFDDVDLSDSTQLHMTNGGGHLGYVAEPGVDPDRRWLDWRVVDWVLERGLAVADEDSSR